MVKKLKLIHVDDDSITLAIFKQIVSLESYIHYQAGFTNAESALNFLENNETDIIILDVEMPGNNGLWLAGQLKGRNIPIVFVTSHIGYAFSAFESLAIDYLLKPITKELVSTLLTRYHQKKALRNFELDKSIEEMTNIITNDESSIKRIFIKTPGTTHVVHLDELMYIKASGSYSQFVRTNNVNHISSHNLKVYAESLSSHPDFVRVHRSYIVNKNFISSVARKGHNTWLVMKDNEKLEISDKLKEEILTLIK